MAYKEAVLTGKGFQIPEKDLILVEKAKLAETGDYVLLPGKFLDASALKCDYPLVRIGECLRLVNGKAFKPEEWSPKECGGLPIIRIQNLNNPDATLNYYTGDIEERYIVDSGSLLFSWSGSRGTSFGPHIWDRERGVLNQHIFLVHHDDRYLRKYLYYVLKKTVAEVESKLHGGVGLVHITKGDFESIRIPLPPLSVQEEIVEELESYEREIDYCMKKIARCRKGIMDKINDLYV